jgi:hypothetical protein
MIQLPNIAEDSEPDYVFEFDFVPASDYVAPRAMYPIVPTALLLQIKNGKFVQLRLIVVEFTHLIQPDLHVVPYQLNTQHLWLEPGDALTKVRVQSVTNRFGSGVFLMLTTQWTEAGKQFTATHQHTIAILPNGAVVH